MSIARFGSVIGDYLIRQGKITDQQLKKALEYQKKQKSRKLLGQVLVELGFVSETEVTKAVAAQAKVPFASLENYRIDESAVNLLNLENIKRYQALPVAFEGEKLVVAMAQPRNVIAIDDLSIITGFPVKPVIVTDSELNAAIDQHARASLNVEQIQEEEQEQEVLVLGDEDEKPAVQLANLIINQAVSSKASDVHIEPQEKNLRIRFRIDGVLHQIMKPPRRLHPSLVSRIKVMANMDIAERRIPQDGRITLKVDDKTVDVRVASLPSAYGEKLTLRILDRDARLLTLSDLGFPLANLNKVNDMIKLPYGFILVTGPTGSGKSTTLYAMLSILNSVTKQIITIEDPVERRIDGVNQIQVSRLAGMTFASGLRSMLRNDPDIIMVGEIRDHETARIAVESALTGHLVLSTLHTNDAAGAITRLAEMGIEPYLTASSLVGVVAQRLVRKICRDCVQEYEITRGELLGSVPDFPLVKGEDKLILNKPGQCVKCSETGYKGRTGIYEVMPISDGIRKKILNRDSDREIKEIAVQEGMATLRQEGLSRVKEGVTSLEEMMRIII